jgi:hypothetical protein
MYSARAVSPTSVASGVGRRKRTSIPAVMNGMGAPGSAFHPRSAASTITSAAPWQSSTVVMIPPLRNPNPLSCAGSEVKRATAISPSRYERRWNPSGFACPQPKQVSVG